jgi:hypothetical protein
MRQRHFIVPWGKYCGEDLLRTPIKDTWYGSRSSFLLNAVTADVRSVQCLTIIHRIQATAGPIGEIR